MTIDDVANSKMYALTYPDGSLVGLDDSSGGYPYRTSSFSGVMLWKTSQEAIKYSNVFPRELFDLVEIRLSFNRVSRATKAAAEIKREAYLT